MRLSLSSLPGVGEEKTLTHNRRQGDRNQDIIKGWVGSQSTGLSSFNIKVVPGGEGEDGSQVQGDAQGGEVYITVIDGTVPQTHRRVGLRARGTHNTTNSTEPQRVRAVNGAVNDVGGVLFRKKLNSFYLRASASFLKR